MPAVAKLLGMGRKKHKGGQHRTPRQPVQIPVTWLKLARELAHKGRPTHTVWYLIGLIHEDAKKNGIPPERIPTFPWDEESA